MDILEKSTCMQDGHYCMDLPFKEVSITMPNDKYITGQWLKSLKRKFDKEPRFQEGYTKFELINNGYAEILPPNEIIGEDGKV